MALRRKTLENMLKKAGLTDDQAADFLKKLDEEQDDTEAAALLASLMTEDEAIGNDKVFGKAKGKARTEALGPLETLLGTYETKLTAAQKADYAKLTDTDKKYQFILTAFDEAGNKTGDKNYDDLKSDFDKLNQRIATDYVAKADFDGVQTRLSAREQELINTRILSAATRCKRLRDISGDRHFDRNFIADTQDLLTTGITDKKLKGVYNAETGKVMRLDSPEQPLLIDGKPVTLDVLADLTISQYDWEKKADAPPKGTITVPAANQTGSTLTPQQRRAIEQQ